jgi:hypothetical protein
MEFTAHQCIVSLTSDNPLADLDSFQQGNTVTIVYLPKIGFMVAEGVLFGESPQVAEAGSRSTTVTTLEPVSFFPSSTPSSSSVLDIISRLSDRYFVISPRRITAPEALAPIVENLALLGTVQLQAILAHFV